MLIGYNTNGFAYHRLEDALAILSELGCQSVAISLDHHALNPYDPELHGQIDRIRRLLSTGRMRSVVETGARFLLDPRRKHQPTLLSLAPSDRERRLEFLRAAVDIASELGSDAVSFWSGVPPDDRRQIHFANLREACCRLCDHASKRQIRLAFEPEPGMLIERMGDYETLARQIDHPLFGLTLDLGHVHCLGDGTCAEHIECHASRCWNIHIEDMLTGQHEHRMFGDGTMSFPPIIGALRNAGYEGALHIELSRHSHDAVQTARKAVQILRELLEAPSRRTSR